MSLKNDMMKHRVMAKRLKSTQEEVINTYLDKLLSVAKSKAKLDIPKAKLKQALQKTTQSLANVAIESLTDIAEYENRFATRMYNKYFKSSANPVDAGILEKKLRSTNMPLNTVKRVGVGQYATDKNTSSRSVAAVYNQFAKKKADEMAQIILDAKVKGLTISEVQDQLLNLRNGLQASQASSLAETTTNYSLNVAKSQAFLENDVVQYVQWDADAELNHCDYCGMMNGRIFPADDAPEVGVHWNCGCELVPVDI